MATNIGPLKTKTDKRDQNFGTSHNPKHDPIPAHQINNHREKYPLFLYSVSCVISTRRKFSFVYLLLPKAPTWTQPLPPEHIIILLLISIQRFTTVFLWPVSFMLSIIALLDLYLYSCVNLSPFQ